MTRSKIVSLPELRRQIAELKRRGNSVVLANGCFDILHVGHIRYLEAAKALGDVLAVALNSDQSVRRLKDAGRPLMPEADRASLVAGLECVDFVVLFSELTVENILRALRPNIHAKGTDYTEETVPEKEIVRSYGGRVAIVGDPKDHSTRDLIHRVMQNTKG
jgi:rfaE bifunctional protein nucleotidyltransferase chain/domain